MAHPFSPIERNHPTSKPVRVFTLPMQLHTRPGDMRYEPFSGSLQLIAGERRAGKFLDWLCPKPSVMMSSGAGRNSPARRLRLMATAAASVKSPPERVPKGKNVAAASTNAHYVFGGRTNQGRGWRRDHRRDAHRGVSSPGSPRPWPRTWPSRHLYRGGECPQLSSVRRSCGAGKRKRQV